MEKLSVSMYHYVRDLQHSRYPGIKGMDISLFRQQIAFMKNHYSIVTMEQVIDAVQRKCKLPENPMLLTFDDGYVDNYTFVMPILEEFGVQGSFFIPGKTFATHQLLDVNKIHYILACADAGELYEDVKREMDYFRGNEFNYPSTAELVNQYAVANRFDTKETIFVKRMLQTVLPEEIRKQIASRLFEKYVGVSEKTLAYELYLSESQIRTMKRHGMFIGIHGYDHYWLGNLEKEKMQNDILMALDALSEFVDRKNWVMNYPYGNYNADVLEYIKGEGACIGFTTEVRIADLYNDNPLTLPRLDCNDYPPKSDRYLTI